MSYEFHNTIRIIFITCYYKHNQRTSMKTSEHPEAGVIGKLNSLLKMTQDLSFYLTAPNPYLRFLETLRSIIPFEASVFFKMEEGQLVPQATIGLSEEASIRKYTIKKHPRLQLISESEGTIQFPPESNLPDPFDGFLFDTNSTHSRIHACMGIPLRTKNELIGVLTADSLEPHQFDYLDQDELSMVGALASLLLQSRTLLDTVQQQAEKQGKLVQDLMKDAQDREGGNIIGTSSVIQKLKQEIELVSKTDLAVLILGETGVGKERVARSIHQSSKRSEQAMIYVNCAALPETIAESELFGHSKGAFTGSEGPRSGKFEIADGGTLFLDEVGELPHSVQSKLLRVLQEGEIQRVGSDKTLKVNVRIIAATNRDLESEVAKGKFRSDLYHRLHVYPLYVPPLRQRGKDILLLAAYFTDKFRIQFGLSALRMSTQTRKLLLEYNWPGNIRELGNIISRGILKASLKQQEKNKPLELTPGDLDIISLNHNQYDSESFEQEEPEKAEEDIQVSNPISSYNKQSLNVYLNLPLNQACDKLKRDLILNRVQKRNGNWSLAAKDLGLHRSNLYQTAKRLGIGKVS